MADAFERELLSKAALVIAAVLGAWFALVFVLGASGRFVSPPGTPPIPIAIGVTAPIIIFFAAFRMSYTFRDLVLTADLRLCTGIQAWRFAGLGFLALYAQGALPGLFAWPAGLGDIAIGLTAPWVTLALIRRESFRFSSLFLVWNLLGILDLIVAVTTGVLSSGLATAIAGEITTAPMAQLPLVLIPAYFVPIFVILHLAAIFQKYTSVRSNN
ncbi:MAG: hypothetical protein ACLP5H_05635 [Desulfomonilaceae bacterium]